jgi:hypothetical protein
MVVTLFIDRGTAASMITVCELLFAPTTTSAALKLLQYRFSLRLFTLILMDV